MVYRILAVIKCLTVVLLIFLIAGCKKSSDVKNISGLPEVKTDPAVVEKISKAKNMNDIFEVKNIIQLETAKESLIGNIETIIYKPEEDKIIILDSESAKGIFVFDTKGKFLKKIGKEGPGPGEYQSLSSIAYDNGVLAVYSVPFKLLLFRLDGTLIKETDFTKRKWMFAPQKLLLVKNDLYMYTNNNSYCTGTDGKKHRVFKIKNLEQFESGYGDPEETYDFSSGDMILFNNRVVFTSVFAGDIYQIILSENNASRLLSLGPLCDLSKLKASQDKLMYLVTHMKEMDSFIQIGEIENLLFMERHYQFVVADNNGNIINKSIKKDLALPSGYGGVASRLGWVFYNKGLIRPSTRKENGNISSTPNLSLIFYGVKNKQ